VVRVVGTPALLFRPWRHNEIEIGNHSYSSLGIAIQNAGDGRPARHLRPVPGRRARQVDHAVYVLKDGPIQKVEDLKARWCPQRRGQRRRRRPMRAMLKKHGLEDKRDFTFIEAPLPAQKAMLLDKKTDLISSVCRSSTIRS